MLVLKTVSSANQSTILKAPNFTGCLGRIELGVSFTPEQLQAYPPRAHDPGFIPSPSFPVSFPFPLSLDLISAGRGSMVPAVSNLEVG